MNLSFSSGDGNMSGLTNSLKVCVVGRGLTVPHTLEELLLLDNP